MWIDFVNAMYNWLDSAVISHCNRSNLMHFTTSNISYSYRCIGFLFESTINKLWETKIRIWFHNCDNVKRTIKEKWSGKLPAKKKREGNRVFKILFHIFKYNDKYVLWIKKREKRNIKIIICDFKRTSKDYVFHLRR